MADDKSLEWSLEEPPRKRPLMRRLTLRREKEPPNLPLPPRFLSTKVKKRTKAKRIAFALLWPGIIATVAYFGRIVVDWSFVSDDFTFGADCSSVTATGIESWFAINIRVPTSFSYSNVRLIDISWDIVIGQGGRLLHGYLFYRKVIVPHLVRLMEGSAVPFSTYISILFDTISIPTIYRLLRSCGRIPSKRIILSVVWYALAIGYVLSFSTIWNATTGYLNPSTRSFEMPDGTYANSSNPTPFSLCYSHNDSRLDGIVPRVIVSPNFADLRDSFYTYVHDDLQRPRDQQLPSLSFSGQGGYGANTFPTSMDLSPYSSAYSDQFRDISYYQSTINELLFVFGKSYFAYYRMYASETTHTYPDTLEGMRATNTTVNVTKTLMEPYSPTTTFRPSFEYRQLLYSSIEGFAYGGPLTRLATDLDRSLNASFLPTPPWGYRHEDDYGNYYSNTTRKSWWGAHQLNEVLYPASGWPASFIFNASVNWDTDAGLVIPYNSTLSWNGTAHALPAPFVDFAAGCPRVRGIGGPCLCYNGAPVPYLLDKSRLVCVSETGYVWGFSSNLLAIAIYLELAWIVVCYAMWLDARINSRMSRMHRSAAGPVRAAVDLIRLAKRDLGEHTDTYSDKDLRHVLEECGVIGYEWRDRSRSRPRNRSHGASEAPAGKGLAEDKDGCQIGDEESLVEHRITTIGLVKREIPTGEQRRRERRARSAEARLVRLRRPLARDLIQRPGAAWRSEDSVASTELAGPSTANLAKMAKPPRSATDLA